MAPRPGCEKSSKADAAEGGSGRGIVQRCGLRFLSYLVLGGIPNSELLVFDSSKF